jgi:predicted transcriptional regulator YdeE
MGDTFFINENDFVFEGMNYQRDTSNGRCYYFEVSRSLRKDCDGKMVRHRIGDNWFLYYREKAMKQLGLTFKDIYTTKQPQSN